MKRTITRLGKLSPLGKFRVLLSCGHVAIHDRGVDARDGRIYVVNISHTCQICAARNPNA